MLKILIEKWNKNKKHLENKLKETKMNYEYKDLVKWTFQYVYNIDIEDETLDIDNITEIDNGDYQGTLLYLIPFDVYHPDEDEYLITYVRYGSCSGCDTLLGIFSGYCYDDINVEDYFYEESCPSENQIKDLMTLCLHLIQNTIRPYGVSSGNEDEWKHLSINDEN